MRITTTFKTPTILACGIYYALFFGFAAAAQASLVADWPVSIWLVLLTAWIGALVGIALIFALSHAPTDNASLLILVAGGIAIDLICNFTASRYAPGEVLRWLLVASGNLGVLAAASGIGLLVARGLRKPNYLVVAAIVGALTDIFSVYAGPSKHLLTSDAFPYVAFSWGVPGEGVGPIVGAGDFIFLALFFAGARKFGLNLLVTFAAMTVAFALGYLSLLLSPQGVPALPFMAFLLLAVHGRELKAQMGKLSPSPN